MYWNLKLDSEVGFLNSEVRVLDSELFRFTILDSELFLANFLDSEFDFWILSFFFEKI